VAFAQELRGSKNTADSACVMKPFKDWFSPTILHFRMIPYGCLATGQSVGMIEVVRNAKTVMHILKQDIRSAMMVRTKELHSWIKEKNRSPSSTVDKTGTSSEGYTYLGHSVIIIIIIVVHF